MKNVRLFLSRCNYIVGAVTLLFLAGLALAMEVCKFAVDPRFLYAAMASEIILIVFSVAVGAAMLYRLKTRGANGQYRAAVLAGSPRACRACRRGGYAVSGFKAILTVCLMFAAGLFFTCTNINISVAAVTDDKNFVQVIHAGGGGVPQ